MENNISEESLLSSKYEIQSEIQIFLGNSKVEEHSEEKLLNPINDSNSDLLEPLEKSKSNSKVTKLSFYWTEIVATLGLFIFIYIYEILGIAVSFSLITLFKEGVTALGTLIKAFANPKIVKWLILNTVFQHLSAGFLCLTTFSNVFKETRNIKKFFIFNIIKVLLYYILSIIILFVFIDKFQLFIQDSIEKNINEISYDKREKIIEMMNKFRDFSLSTVGNLLATFNVFLDKLVIGTLYIFLFIVPKKIKCTNKIFLISLSLFPIIYIISNLGLRALEAAEKINLNAFISPILLGPKISIYGFFISTLCIIKYKSTKINVFDEENTILPEIFSKIGSKTFLFFGIIEAIIGFFYPEWSKFGIGKNYLLIACTPFISIYDYKKESKIKFPCCKNRDFSKCFKIMFNVVGYFLLVILGIALYVLINIIIEYYISNIIKVILENFEKIVFVIFNLISYIY